MAPTCTRATTTSCTCTQCGAGHAAYGIRSDATVAAGVWRRRSCVQLTSCDVTELSLLSFFCSIGWATCLLSSFGHCVPSTGVRFSLRGVMEVAVPSPPCGERPTSCSLAVPLSAHHLGRGRHVVHAPNSTELLLPLLPCKHAVLQPFIL